MCVCEVISDICVCEVISDMCDCDVMWCVWCVMCVCDVLWVLIILIITNRRRFWWWNYIWDFGKIYWFNYWLIIITITLFIIIFIIIHINTPHTHPQMMSIVRMMIIIIVLLTAHVIGPKLAILIPVNLINLTLLSMIKTVNNRSLYLTPNLTPNLNIIHTILIITDIPIINYE